jgi:hypothetical protein
VAGAELGLRVEDEASALAAGRGVVLATLAARLGSYLCGDIITASPAFQKLNGSPIGEEEMEDEEESVKGSRELSEELFGTRVDVSTAAERTIPFAGFAKGRLRAFMPQHLKRRLPEAGKHWAQRSSLHHVLLLSTQKIAGLGSLQKLGVRIQEKVEK